MNADQSSVSLPAAPSTMPDSEEPAANTKLSAAAFPVRLPKSVQLIVFPET
ncbi:hypothetical protein D3C83_62270 [compost metagenome]